jgi:hypothetical protein
MKRMTWVGVLTALGVASLALAAETTTTTTTTTTGPVAQYLGAAKCKTCHNSAKKGAQFKVWSDSKHAHAFLELASPKALEIAAKAGIKDPQKAPECLSCHVTGAGEPADHFAASFSDSAGVQCESCHGAGSNYYKMAAMKEIRADKTPASAAKYGLLMPTKQTCAKCHNEKATNGKFVEWPADSAKIAHPIPPGAETAP